MKEDQIQREVIVWRDKYQHIDPRVTYLHHIQNNSSSGQQGMLRKALGVTSGIADLCLPIPIQPYGALYIELKTQIGRQTKEQRAFEAHCKQYGNIYLIARSSNEAIAIILDYLTPLSP